MHAASGFDCPNCGSASTKVTTTRTYRSNRHSTIRRHRRCLTCDKRFETIEQLFIRPGGTKLSGAMAGVIRRRYAQTPRPSMRALAQEFGVAQRTVWGIINNDRWIPER